jgi:hypothetical protein
MAGSNTAWQLEDFVDSLVIDLDKTRETLAKRVADTDIDYRSLANRIQKAQRGNAPPMVRSVSLSHDDDGAQSLLVSGRNLAVNPRFAPVAVINDGLAEVLSYDEGHVRIGLPPSHDFSTPTEVVLTCDPFAVFKVHVNAEGGHRHETETPH